MLSILISSHDRSALLKRTLWSIANRPPRLPYEVILADDGSQEDIVGLLRLFSPCFPWKFIRADVGEFERVTGVKKFFNNPAWTNNLAFTHSKGEKIFLMGNEIIAWGDVFDSLLDAAPKDSEDWLAFSTTYDVGQHILDGLDEYGGNLTDHMVKQCHRFPLQGRTYPSDVTNYLSLCPRSVWERIGGYDERYVGGISADDSDFVRRARQLGVKTTISEGISLHQHHYGKTAYYDPPPGTITPRRWDEGARHNHGIYRAWDGTHLNRQSWPWGSVGIMEVISNES